MVDAHTKAAYVTHINSHNTHTPPPLLQPEEEQGHWDKLARLFSPLSPWLFLSLSARSLHFFIAPLFQIIYCPLLFFFCFCLSGYQIIYCPFAFK